MTTSLPPITPPGYDAGEHTLTVEDVARALDTTPGQIFDAMRAHLIGYLVLPDVSGESRPRVRFALAEAKRYQGMKDRGEAPHNRRNVLRVSAYLRAYLDAVEPDYEYDSALERGAPLWVSLRGQKALYIQVSALSRFVESTGSVLTKTTATEALKFMRCLPRRGVVAYGEQGSKARWATWWRVPNSFIPDAEMYDNLADDAVFGLLQEDDRVTTVSQGSAEGEPYLDGMLGQDD
jgi:hypothetical protein